MDYDFATAWLKDIVPFFLRNKWYSHAFLACFTRSVIAFCNAAMCHYDVIIVLSPVSLFKWTGRQPIILWFFAHYDPLCFFGMTNLRVDPM